MRRALRAGHGKTVGTERHFVPVPPPPSGGTSPDGGGIKGGLRPLTCLQGFDPHPIRLRAGHGKTMGTERHSVPAPSAAFRRHLPDGEELKEGCAP